MKRQVSERGLWVAHATGIILLVVVLRSFQDTASSSYENTATRRKLSAVVETAQQWDAVCVGNSMIGFNTDEEKLASLSNLRLRLLWQPGVRASWWYLAGKRLLEQTSQRPRMLVVFFRENDLTDHSARLFGSYLRDSLALYETKDREVEELAFRRAMSPPRYFMFTNSVAFRHRRVLFHDRAISFAYGRAADLWSLFGAARPRPKSILNQLFKMGARQPKKTDEGTLEFGLPQSQKMAALDFDTELKQSLLPYFFRQAEQYHTQLVFVHCRTRGDAASNGQDERARYFVELQRFIIDHGGQFIDYSNRDTLSINDFVDSAHLNEEGKAKFTTQLAKDLRMIAEDFGG
ncbi:hypothetical protein N9D23_13860 [Rubripirellula sp.]|nr:hypothetical protein [Rubripirellula sp.]